MKKKLAAAMVGIMTFSIALTGCSGNEISTDNISLKGYKGVEVAKIEEQQEITDEMVDAQMNSVLEQSATEEQITDRAVADGDTVNVNYSGKIDGAEFDGGTAEGASVTVGSGRFIEGFEESLIGHKGGETYDWEGSFPEEYDSNPDLAGKAVTFTMTVNYISNMVTPELNDEFVKSVSEESKTVEEYKKEMKKAMQESTEASYNDTLKESAWAAVVELAEVKKYPEENIKKISDQIVEQYKSAAEYYQLEYEKFIEQQNGTTVEDFEKQVEEAAKSSVKQELVAKAIADAEKLTPTDKEYKEAFKELAKQYGYEDVDALKEVAEEEDLKAMVIQDTVKEWVAKHCIQVVQEEEKTEDTKTTEE